MRVFCHSILFAFATSLLVSIGLTPAAATNAREAIKLCDKNPNCSYNVRDNGSVDLCVKKSDGNCNYINCPQTGNCTCDVCDHSAIKTGGKTIKSNVQGILTAMPAGTRPRPKAQGLPDGGLLQSGPGFGAQGPAGAGTPARGAAPQGGQLR